MSSFSILIAVLGGVTVVVCLLSVAALTSYSERRTRKREEELAEQVKMQLADLRNSPPPQQNRVGQGNYDFEHTEYEAGERAKESTGQSANQTQDRVGQDAVQRRATEAEPRATFHLGSVLDRQGEYDRAVEAYQQVIASGHPEARPRAAFNLGILFEERVEYDRAVVAYRQAIDSEHAEWAPKAAFDLGMLFEERVEYDLAEEAYQWAIDSEHPEEAPRAAFNLGLMLEKQGKYTRAEEAYQKAIDSGHPEIALRGLRNLRGLPMRFPKRFRQG
jgi:tetratricopeptide (TPR) repeat protein